MNGLSNAAFGDLNPAQMIGYRNIREHKTESGLKAFTSDFSLHHALMVVQPLKQMLKSNNSQARKVAAHMLKTLAIMNTLSNSNDYHAVQKPRLTAWMQ